MRLDITDLRLFAHVIDASSISRGAERSSLAVASASERIRGMEELLGIKLLQRVRHGVRPTAAGERLLGHARTIVRQSEQMRGDLAGYARGLKGRLRLLSNTAALSEHLPELLAGFLVANPHIDIDVEEQESADLVTAIAGGLADIGVGSEAVASPALLRFPFREDRLVVIVPVADPLLRRRSIDFADLLGRDFVALPREAALQRHIEDHAARLGGNLPARIRVPGLDAVCRMVAAGAGIAIVPETAWARRRKAVRIERIVLNDAWSRRKLVLYVQRRDSLSVPARRLLAHLRRSHAATF